MLATELLGQAWYQWLSYAGGAPKRVFAITTIVHANGGREHADKLYPVIKETQTDYRCVRYSDAIDYIGRTLEFYYEAAAEGLDTSSGIAELNSLHKEIKNTVCPSL